jgi:cell division protein FtsB
MATQTEMAAALREVVVQLQKSNNEIKTVQASVDVLKTRIADLEKIITDGDVASQELIDAVAAVKVAAQTVDDDIPDEVTPPPTI